MTGINFHRSGFLSFGRSSESVDGTASTFAFHQLPDYWKGVALKRMSKMFKSGGRLYLRDLVMVIEEGNSLADICALIDRQEELGGELLRQDAFKHSRDEYSTYDCFMAGMLKRAGFRIESKETDGGLLAILSRDKGMRSRLVTPSKPMVDYSLTERFK